MASFTLTSRIKAPIDVVFDVLTDHRGYAKFIPGLRVGIEQEGDPVPNGVGAIRVMRSVGPPIREQVTEYLKPTRFAYRLLSGAPVRNHTGIVELADDGGGATNMVYRVETTPTVPGILGPGVVAFMRLGVGRLAGGVAKAAEKRAGTRG
jgi:uncharacterized protein YndB with AHSA1/START domain